MNILKVLKRHTLMYVLLIVVACTNVTIYAEEEIVRTLYLGEGHYSALAWSYEKQDSLAYRLKITLTLEPKYPGGEMKPATINYRPQENSPPQKITLSEQKPTVTIDVQASQELGWVDTTYEYIRIEMDDASKASGMKVFVTYSRDKLGLERDGGLAFHGVSSSKDLEVVVQDADRYDYYVGYSVGIPVGGQVTCRYFINGIEKFSKTFYAISGGFGFTYVPNLKPGDTLKIEAEVANAPLSHAAYTSMSIYKRINPFTLSISSVYEKIGDNTNVVLNTNVSGPEGYYLEIFNVATGKIYDKRSCVNIPSTIYVNLGSDVGDISVVGRIVDSTGEEYRRSSTMSINKRNSLGGMLDLMYTIGESGIGILSDHYRYFESNASNIKLVSDIRNTNKPVYLVGNILESSKALLQSLLKS